MLTIGIDPHKQTHTGVAVDPLGVQVAQRTSSARREGFGQLLEWGRKLASERIWVIEDVRHVSGSLERFLLDRGETVVRLPPRLMADARRGVRERGKSDPIDALAIARAALREGVETLPTARLAGPELEIRLLGLHRERLVATRTRLTNELRWQLHDLWPDWEIPRAGLNLPSWQTKVARRLAHAEPSVRVQIARDMSDPSCSSTDCATIAPQSPPETSGSLPPDGGSREPRNYSFAARTHETRKSSGGFESRKRQARALLGTESVTGIGREGSKGIA